MPNDRVLNLPLSSDEIIEILLQRFEKKLRSDCFLHPANTYNGFRYSMELKLTFADMMMGRETLVWDQHTEPRQDMGTEMLEDNPIAQNVEATASENFDSGDSPNRTREDHDLPMPVETTEGKRKVIRHRRLGDAA